MDEFEISGGTARHDAAPRKKWPLRWFPKVRVDKASLHSARIDVEEGLGLLNGSRSLETSRIQEGMHSLRYNGKSMGRTFLYIIVVLLAANLILVPLFFRRKSDTKDPLSGWGKPGTTSEGLSWYPTDFLRDVIPIPCHSHNDYWRRVPLFSALYSGCISVEADVWYFEDELFVGHNTASLTVNRTFQSLYVKPLVEILSRQNPSTEFYNGTLHGVFDTDSEQSLTLLVDVKTDGAQTWPIVLRQLEPLRQRGWLSYVEDGVIHQRPITVVGTGETPFDVLVANKTYRDAFFDAPLDQLLQTKSNSYQTEHSRGGQGSSGTVPTDDYSVQNSFYASTSFKDVVGRIWWGKLSERQMGLIREHISAAHSQGLKARFWEQPSWPIRLRNYVWDVLVQEGIDVLNVDDLEAVSKDLW